MTTPAKFKTSKEAKKAGWFSRRHQTNEALLETRKRREEIKNKTKV